MENFAGKVAVVTGAGSGIGAALVAGFANEGMRVVAADINGDSAEATAAAVNAQHTDAAVAMQLDVADAGAMAVFANDCFAQMGQVDVLCNNAGVFQAGISWERSAEDWEWVMGVNVMGIAHAIREFVPRMIAQDTEGHVINTASVAAFVAGAYSGPYVVSKCAAMSITECLALDLQATGSKLKASVLTPSAFDTGISQTAAVRPDKYGTDTKEDSAFVNASLADMTAKGMTADKAVEPVLNGIRTGDFLIPTMPSYKAQLTNRFEALLERQLPGPTPVD